MIALDVVDHLTGGRLGTHDVACPMCGPYRRTLANQHRKVLRVYRIEAGFAGYHCARCGEKGAAFDRDSRPPDPTKLAKARAAAAERDHALKAERLGKARWLWSVRMPIAGTAGETYLREARGYAGPLPATLGFLPSRGSHPPAMIAAFGLSREIEPGVITIPDSAVHGLHLTRLMPDGSGKAVFEDPDENAKIMVGFSAGWPIVLAPMGDLCGLAIAEGIENALSVHEATGLGSWAAGCASRMAALADVIPDHVECITVIGDDDDDGRRHATELARRVHARGIETRIFVPRTKRMAA